jgi:hypothetical protein
MKFPCIDLLLNISKVFRSISWRQKTIAGQKVTEQNLEAIRRLDQKENWKQMPIK